MPTFLFTSPEGTKYKVTGPEGATAEQAFALIQPQSAARPAAAPEEAFDPAAEMSGGQRFAAGAGKAVSDLARGVGQVSTLLTGQSAASGQLKAEEAAARQRDAPLMQTGAGLAGNIAGNVALAVPASIIPGAATVPGAALTGAAFGAAQPTVEGESRLANTAIGTAFGAGGQFAGQKIAGAAASKLAQRTASAEAAKAANVGRDEVLAASQKAGYVLPPAMVNPSMGVSAAESLSGKAATAQTASLKNQQVTERLVREELSLPADVKLNRSTLQAVRSRAGRVYADVARTGRVKPSEEFRAKLSGFAKESKEIAEDFPGADFADVDEIAALAKSLDRESFSAQNGLTYLKTLRRRASRHMANRDTQELGHAERKAAEVLEDELMAHVKQTGNAELAASFDDARKLIAKTYNVQSALVGSRVSATKIGKQLERGAPLSGNLKLVGQFAQEFDKAAKLMRESPGVSNVDAMVAAIGTSLTGNPAALAYPGGRWVARQVLLSQTGQRAFATPNYKPTTADLALLRSVSQRLALPGAVGASGVANAEQ